MKTQRVIRLPNGRDCTLGTYCKAWKSLLATPPETRVAGFSHFPEEAGRVLETMRYGLHARINRHLPHYGKGRKWDPLWQTEAYRAARAANTPRLAVGWVPRDFRARLAHRISQGGGP